MFYIMYIDSLVLVMYIFYTILVKYFDIFAGDIFRMCSFMIRNLKSEL
jgi:hypothetical protein